MSEEADSGARKRYVLVYTDKYIVDIGPHVFPVVKYPQVVDRLIGECGVARHEFLEPERATRDQLLLAHTPEYITDLTELKWTSRTMRSELPLTAEIANAYILAAGGSVLAAREAVERKGFGVHVGGGFHHTYPDHAEGFCYVNDIAVAVRVLQREGRIEKAAIVDCDLHQGNGTARIFQGDETVFTFSIHQENNYPAKEPGDMDIGLRDGATDEEYLNELGRCVPGRLDEFKPEFVVYVAGADPFRDDMLGGLALSKEGLAKRDDLVINYCEKRSIPMMSVLAGGYAVNTDDTVDIHTTTCRKMIEAGRKERAKAR